MGFREQLEKELEKRQLNGQEQDQPSAETAPSSSAAPRAEGSTGVFSGSSSFAPRSSKTSKKESGGFSLRSFGIGLLMGALFLVALTVWAFLQADETDNAMRQRLSSKTAMVDNILPLEEEITQEAAQAPLDVREVAPVIAVPPGEEAQAPRPPSSGTVTDAVAPPETPVPETPSEPEDAALVTAPVPELYESTPAGIKPKVRERDGLTAFEAYQKPYTIRSGKPVISLVVTNLGISSAVTRAAISELPSGVSLSFSPYASDLQTMVDEARGDGHEVWLTLPLESEDFPLQDPGPLTFLNNVAEAQNQQRLDRLLASVAGYVGFVPNKDHAFTSQNALSPTIQEIFARGLAVVESRSGRDNFIRETAVKNDYPFGKTDFWLDEDKTPMALNRRIRQMMELARARGSAVIMVEPYPASINAVNKFLSSAAADEFQIAPLSAQVQYGE
jgi:polysaccharide deacetylase 2 family uncharacterized protein YibQ